ncbi:ribokinase [Thermomonas sp. HDW16]|uniref:ribokinase n=1 Tax=Thermomonas sp. HDW16 TaxID=2714945 RepID=UPI00140B909A|nr:ribokinase [Thermomonas sp. HDW16]QIL19956.1 ribokinase [Thermomonas sp. HDW16]
MPRVTVVGSFNVDHVWRVATLPQPGATLSGEYASGPGGKGFNQAMAARRAGAKTSFICALGGDLGAQLARALCVADGIDLRDAESSAPTGTAGIYVDAAGRNSIVIGPGANAALGAEFVAASLAAFDDVAVVLAQLESPIDAIAQALERGRALGATTILNPAPANVAAPGAMLELADILTPNETEFVALLGRHVGERIEADAVAGIDQARLHALCRQLGHDSTVVVTLGSSGCFVSHPETNLRGDETACYRIAAEAVRAIDTTGAGDAFNGSLAASLAQRPQRAFAEHTRFASRYAGLSTERAGAALAMPREDELLAKYGS